MKKQLCTLLLALSGLFALHAQQDKGTFTVGKNEFLLNGKPYIIRAGEIHYSRIPKAYWDDRIKMVKAMGMNTICIYLFWNYHEMQQGVFDFSGEKDVADFVRLIQKNGMYCILRPGPYACAEWDMGGLPWWLLKKPDLKVRTKADSFFLDRAKIYLNQAGKQLAPLQIQNGGPIIMVQVENEYASWGDDQKYMEIIRDYIREAGFDKAQLVRCDWSSNFSRYTLPGVATALNFGAGSNIDNQFSKFKTMHPDAPLMCGEYWTGWFDKWGRPHETRSVASFIGSLKDMMDRKISFSLYMAHGGTSFGQWAGANAPAYAPTTSSYDYNAPIDEAGNPTEKFYAIRNLLKNYLQEGETLPEIPANPEKIISIPAITLSQSAPLFKNLPDPKHSATIQPMEYFNQGWGSILYRTTLPASKLKQTLTINQVHDWAQVFVNGKLIGKLDRRKDEKQLELPPRTSVSQLDILVEGMGRVNYGGAIIDRKGITHEVTLTNPDKTGAVLKGWTVYNLPVDYQFQKQAKFGNQMPDGPAWYRGTFNLRETGYTYFNMSGWGKGMVWINGHNLGRFWKIGPTQTLCVPGVFLKKGLNEIIVFDLLKPSSTTIEGLNHPILDVLVQEDTQNKYSKIPNLKGLKPVSSGTFTAESGWKTVTFVQPHVGRYFCFEALSPQTTGDNAASAAEFEILGEDGKAISSLNWKVIYADSEETQKVANGADKLFDLQESIIWQTSLTDKSRYPHRVAIDMGKTIKVTGFRILPRSDNSSRGVIKDYRFYLSKGGW